MVALVVVGHPRPDSFNHAIARRAAGTLRELGHEVVLRDLQAEDFDPVLPGREEPAGGHIDPTVAEHCAELAAAEAIVVVHPNWWGMPPAVMKGWIDRVFRPRVAYRFDEGDDGAGVPVGLLGARVAVVLNTSNTETLRETEVFGDPLDRIWRDCIFGLCGIANVHRRMFRIICTSTPQQRARWLDEVEEIIRETVGPPHREDAP
ncbi:MAG: NAD(P)H-dependent oxidoreductase [Armatimonadota bacterium]